MKEQELIIIIIMEWSLVSSFTFSHAFSPSYSSPVVFSSLAGSSSSGAVVEMDGNIKIGDTPLNVLLQQAATLKTEQLAVDRRKYDSWPSWYRNTFFASPEIKEMRRCTNFQERLAFVNAFKEQGNYSYSVGDFDGAIVCYERALGLWEWCQTCVEDWQRTPIRDSDLTQHVYEPESAQDRETLRQSQLTLWNNLAAAHLEKHDYPQCIAVCSYVIERQPDCAKAYFRRGRALAEPLSASTVQQQSALRDFQRAQELAPHEERYHQTYLQWREKLRVQQSKDKAKFGGFLHKKRNESIYLSDEDDDHAASNRKASKSASSLDVSSSSSAPPSRANAQSLSSQQDDNDEDNLTSLTPKQIQRLLAHLDRAVEQAADRLQYARQRCQKKGGEVDDDEEVQQAQRDYEAVAAKQREIRKMLAQGTTTSGSSCLEAEAASLTSASPVAPISSVSQADASASRATCTASTHFATTTAASSSSNTTTSLDIDQAIEDAYRQESADLAEKVLQDTGELSQRLLLFCRLTHSLSTVHVHHALLPHKDNKKSNEHLELPPVVSSVVWKWWKQIADRDLAPVLTLSPKTDKGANDEDIKKKEGDLDNLQQAQRTLQQYLLRVERQSQSNSLSGLDLELTGTDSSSAQSNRSPSFLSLIIGFLTSAYRLVAAMYTTLRFTPDEAVHSHHRLLFSVLAVAVLPPAVYPLDNSRLNNNEKSEEKNNNTEAVQVLGLSASEVEDWLRQSLTEDFLNCYRAFSRQEASTRVGENSTEPDRNDDRGDRNTETETETPKETETETERWQRMLQQTLQRYYETVSSEAPSNADQCFQKYTPFQYKKLYKERQRLVQYRGQSPPQRLHSWLEYFADLWLEVCSGKMISCIAWYSVLIACFLIVYMMVTGYLQDMREKLAQPSAL